MPSTRVGQNLAIVAVFAVLSIAGLLFMAVNTGQRLGPLPAQYQLAFTVADADGLPEGGDVRIAGIQVGKVTSVTPIATGSRVVIGIDPQYNPVYTDATVLIRPKSLLGEKYVDMVRGTSNVAIPDGGTIPTSQAFTQVELDQVLESSDAETRKAVSIDFQGLGQAVAGRGQDLNATIPELRNIAEHLTPVSARFADRTAQIDHILVDTDTILSTLADEHAQVALLLQAGDNVTGTIATNDAHLASILNNGSATFSRINAAVGQQNNDQNIHTAIQNAPGVLRNVNTFLDLLNADLETAVPSLLLGQQYTYPNDQLTIAMGKATQTDFEWDSATRIYDPGAGGYNPVTGVTGTHGFLANGVMCNDGSNPLQAYAPSSSYPYACPGTYDKNTPVPSRSTGMISPEQSQLLAYLLGQ